MRATDYLIVGAGASGLAFADTILDQSDAELILVDRRTSVGGHWRDTYPFVRLHSPSAFYGVNSMPLGQDRLIAGGRNDGFYEQATGTEICDYFEAVLTERLEPSGRADFLGGQDFVGFDDGIATLRNRTTGEVSEIAVRRRVVDARYQEASIPATHTPSFTVDADAAFVPIGGLPDRVGDFRDFTIIGAGKTAADACLWLLDEGVDPDRIHWIRPRDMWFNDRAGFQPLDSVGSIMAGLADDAESGAQARDLADLCRLLEDCGRFMRLDPTVEPTMYRGTMLSRPEWASLKQIENVTRAGYVMAIGTHGVTLADRGVPSGPKTLNVDCSARGLAPSPPVAIFDGPNIRIQQARHNSPTFNAALIAFLETNRDNDAERNRLAPPNPYASTPRDMASMFSRTWTTEGTWQAEPDLQGWIDSSRLNLLKGLPAKMSEPAVNEAVVRLLTNIGPAIERMPTLV